LQLRRRGITSVVLGGISTDYGVESTARDAYERGYDLVFVEDAMRARGFRSPWTPIPPASRSPVPGPAITYRSEATCVILPVPS